MAVIKSKWNWAIQYITYLFVGTWCAWVKNTCLEIFRHTYLVKFCGSSSHKYRKKLKILHRKEDIQGIWEAWSWWDWSTKFLSLFRVIDFPQYKRSSIFVIVLPVNIKSINTPMIPLNVPIFKSFAIHKMPLFSSLFELPSLYYGLYYPIEILWLPIVETTSKCIRERNLSLMKNIIWIKTFIILCRSKERA